MKARLQDHLTLAMLAVQLVAWFYFRSPAAWIIPLLVIGTLAGVATARDSFIYRLWQSHGRGMMEAAVCLSLVAAGIFLFFDDPRFLLFGVILVDFCYTHFVAHLCSALRQRRERIRM